MNTPNSPKNGAREQTDPTMQRLADDMQEGLSVFMTVPQKLMQANLEAFAEGMNFMQRRMKAQATIWSGLGRVGTGNGNLGDTQQHFINDMAQEMAAEMKEFSELAKKNMALAADVAMSAGKGFVPGRTS